MTFAVQRAGERATFDHGWLLTSHSFSFAEYHDPSNVNWGALRVFNDDRVTAGAGFPTHAHRDMEIVTYVLSGELEHRDSIGNHGVVGPGGVQYMSAGNGVRHSEYNGSPNEGLHFLQMWVLPGTLGGPPSYGQVAFDIAQRLNKWLLIASGNDRRAPVSLTQDATLLVARLDDAQLQHRFGAQRLGFLFVAEGAVSVSAVGDDGSSRSAELGAGDGVRLGGISQITLHGTGEAVLWDVPP
jgi:hypothetical protein